MIEYDIKVGEVRWFVGWGEKGANPYLYNERVTRIIPRKSRNGKNLQPKYEVTISGAAFGDGSTTRTTLYVGGEKTPEAAVASAASYMFNDMRNQGDRYTEDGGKADLTTAGGIAYTGQRLIELARCLKEYRSVTEAK